MPYEEKMLTKLYKGIPFAMSIYFVYNLFISP